MERKMKEVNEIRYKSLKQKVEADGLEKLNKHEEYAFFIFQYLFPLLGIPIDSNSILERWNSDEKIKDVFSQKEDSYVLRFAPHHKPTFIFSANRKLDDSDIRCTKKILEAFTKVSRLRWRNGKQQHQYGSKLIFEKNYDMAIQNGIAAWIAGSDEPNASDHYIDLLLSAFERWAVKTYEGKKVTFGFLINKGKMANTTAPNMLEFLKDDYSATLTDCINSIFEIDKQCLLIQYHSITENNIIKQVSINPKIPYRFSHILCNYEDEGESNKTVGAFLLSNGDIVLSEGKEIRFIKRNLKWLSLSLNGFLNAAERFNGDQGLISEIYASTLDVSFAHTGGIIAIISDFSALKSKPKGKGILADIDDLEYEKEKSLENQLRKQLEKGLSEVEKSLQDEAVSRDIRKRLLKRQVKKTLISNKKFTEIDRKLRAELIAMDGACIIKEDGTVCSFGAIIQNDSGSSGGGRGAASKKLSKYGMAIKISTDGYIEMYIKGELVYAVK